MEQPTHIIDPDGEVVIILRNANAAFVEMDGGMAADSESQPSAEPVESSDDRVDSPPTNRSSLEMMMMEKRSSASVSESATGPVDEPHEKNCFRVRVSAKHLIFASPVFKSILKGGWKEGVAFLQEGSVEITAESWDVGAFLILLRAIHGQHYDIPRKLSLEMLAKVAVIADYYDCKPALYIMFDIWVNALEEKIPGSYCRELILWLWISWFFRLPNQFMQVTSIAMAQADDRISNLGLPIPDRIIGAMNDMRQRAIEDAVSQLHETREAFQNSKKGCSFECSAIMYGALTMHSQSNALLSPKPAPPFSGLAYQNLVQSIRSFKSPVWYDPDPQKSPAVLGGRGWHSHGPHMGNHNASVSPHYCIDSYFLYLFNKLDGCIGGLEIDSFIP
ncbi:hypothetical protein BJX61DRAFT_533196 [Aspergillus egyptiacus]|nr:hypothetical protein BJX61DRAFT_533196 [Aspergillus egyptiacus]